MPGILLHLLVLVLVSGCTVHRVESEPPANWRFIGKLSLRTGEESRILSIDWQQLEDVSEITLKGPLGVKVAKVTASEDGLVVDSGRQVARYREDAVLTEAGFEGLKLPWKSLAYWVRGQSGPGGQKLVGTTIQRGNWYFKITEMGALGPLTMMLEHPRVKLRLRVRKWTISAEETALQKIRHRLRR